MYDMRCKLQTRREERPVMVACHTHAVNLSLIYVGVYCFGKAVSNLIETSQSRQDGIGSRTQSSGPLGIVSDVGPHVYTGSPGIFSFIGDFHVLRPRSRLRTCASRKRASAH